MGFGAWSVFIRLYSRIQRDSERARVTRDVRNVTKPRYDFYGRSNVSRSSIDYTLGAMYAHEMLLFCGLFAMIISILHVIGHTRKEEDLGLTELVRSFQVGRQANSFAAIAEVVFINVILALFIAGVM